MPLLLLRLPLPVVQIAGVPTALIVLGLIVALIVWRRRATWRWLRERGRSFWVGVSVVGIGALVTGGTFVFRAWDYVQHDDEFCNSCHLEEPSFERLSQSEHSELNCTACHQPSTSETLRQIRWVFDPPKEVGPHAPVPPGACAECHVTEGPDSTWQRISATVGHRVHLEADNSALEDVTCLTCHGEELHRFVPADATCGQAGCHDPSKTDVVLGDMAGQTGFHCVTCHQFIAPVSEQAPLDTVRVALVPALAQCGSCHEMEKVLAGLDPELDPHDAICGTCHNPHTQESPAEAANRCAECHAPVEGLTPFHRGLSAAVIEDCRGCHTPHTFKVEGRNCAACHADIVGGTSKAGPDARHGQQTRLEGDDRRETVVAMVVSLEARRVAFQPAASFVDLVSSLQQQPRFNHREHAEVQCTDCHTSRRTHGEVTLESRAQCLQCHHRRVAPAAGCARCHSAREASAPRAVQVAMTIRGRTSERRIAFEHGKHARVGCATCHTQGATLGVSRTCASCHENHHTATADCASCHRANAIESHTREIHTRSCSGSSCHESGRFGSMTQGRNTCLACHVDKVEHRPGRACAACHRVTFASAATPAAVAGRR